MARDVLTDGWRLDAWLLPIEPCERCSSTAYGCRIPDMLCDQCMTREEYASLYYQFNYVFSL